MGKTNSFSKDDKNKILASPTIEAVAQLINAGKAKRIIVMAGAGLSTAAGIPDFRTPGTGLYDNLQKYNLPYPEAIFDISYFQENPEPFFELTRELFPGKFLPTLAHYFLVLLHRKTLLYRCFTQNIDTLERITGLPDGMVVEAHGSFAKSKCLECNKTFDIKWMKDMIDKVKVPKCDSCSGIVKPCITFFGETLPNDFFMRLSDFRSCDLLIVIGTSLQVQPFAGLIDSVGSKVPRLLINLEKVGTDMGMGFDFDGKYQKYNRDAFYKGTCDEGVKKLAELCGWKDELLKIYEEGRASLLKEYGPTPTPIDIVTEVKKRTEQKSRAEEAVDQLAKEFEDKIKIKSEISDEVDQMLKEFDKKLDLEGKKSDEKEELLNEEKHIAKSDEKKEELKDKDNKENLINIAIESKESKEIKNIEGDKKIDENTKIDEKL